MEIQCIGSFSTLFEMLKPNYNIEVQVNVLKVILVVTRNQECINDIASANVLIHLLLSLYMLPDHREISLECLVGLCTSTTIVKDLIARGKLNNMFSSKHNLTLKF